MQTQTETKPQAKSFMTACREFFKEGQTGLQFGKEVQELTREDKVEIREGLAALGIHCAEIA